VVTFGHVTKMATIPFDPPYPKTTCCTQTSPLYLLQNQDYRIADRSFTLRVCGNREFRAFLPLWPWPWPDDVRIWNSPVSPHAVPAD